MTKSLSNQTTNKRTVNILNAERKVNQKLVYSIYSPFKWMRNRDTERRKKNFIQDIESPNFDDNPKSLEYSQEST